MTKPHTILAGMTIWAATAAAQQDSISFHQLDDAVVTGVRTRATTRNIPFTISSVDRNILTAQQRVSILPTISEQVPGLFVTQRGTMGFGVSGGAAGGMTLRGISSASGQLLVLIDGHPQYQGIYGHSISDAYQTMIADKVEVLRGPASVLYGSNAMGGVINIISRKPRADGVFNHINLGAGSYGTVQAEASNVVRKGKFSSTVAVQYGRSDNHRPNMGFQQFGSYVRLGYELDEHFRLFGHANVTHFNASNPGTISAPILEADQWITRSALTFGIENEDEHCKGRIALYTDFGRHKINDGYSAHNGTPQPRLFRSKDALAGLSGYENFYLWKGSEVTLGFDYQQIYGNAYYTNRKTGEVLNTPNKQSGKANMSEIAGYVDLRQNLWKWCLVEAGVRYDYHSIVGGEWVPQFGIVTHPMKDGEIRASVSRGFRNPTMKEMYLYPPSNTDLLPEDLWNYEIAWRHELLFNSAAHQSLVYGLNLFFMQGSNLIQTGMKTFADGTSKMQNINTGELCNKGAEFDLQWNVNRHWSLMTNHSYLHMKHHLLATPTYKGFIGANMHYGKWNANVGLQQINGLYTSVDGKNPQNDTKETFTLLNATVSYQLLPCLQLWGKGENILGQKYEINAGFPMPKATFMGGVNIKF